MRRLSALLACLGILLCLHAPTALAGTVQGTVTPVEWAQEVEVCAFGVEAYERCAVPGADGSYTYPGVEGTVTLEFIPTYRSRLLTQYYDHVGALKEATHITVARGEVREHIDADLTEGGSITGTVTAAAGGADLAEVEECAVSVTTPIVKSCEETDASGVYELHSLPTGRYTVGFSGEGMSAGYQPSYYQGKPSSTEATQILVTAGGTVAGIDATLAEGAAITGSVTAAAGGTPLGGITVCLFTVTGSAPERCTESDGAGTYSFQGLIDGSYQVGFSLEASELGGSGGAGGADGFGSQYFDGVATRAAAATLPLLAPATAEGVDAALLSPPLPPPPAVAPVVSNSVTAAPPTVVPPQPKKAGCRKPKRKKKVKGKVRCVKPVGHKKTKKPAKHSHKKVHKGKGGM